MPTTKKRVAVTLDKDTEWALKKLSRMYKVPLATKASELLRLGIETWEDTVWAGIAGERSRNKNKKYISQEKFWKNKI